MRAVAVFASLSFFRSPVTSMIRLSGSPFSSPSIDPDEEVGVILPFDAVDRVGDREPETLVLDVGDDFAHVFEFLSQLGFPVAIERDVRDVALVGPGLVCRPDRVEIDIASRPDGLVRPEDRLERRRPRGRLDDRAVDPVRPLGA